MCRIKRRYYILTGSLIRNCCTSCSGLKSCLNHRLIIQAESEIDITAVDLLKIGILRVTTVSMHNTFHYGVHPGNFIFNIFKRQPFVEFSIIKGIIFIQ